MSNDPIQTSWIEWVTRVAAGAIAYISTADRADMLRSIKEWVAAQEAGLTTDPPGERTRVNQPDQYLIDKALEVAAWSPCQKSRRGVVIWDPANVAHRGSGFNGPPKGFMCPGREACRGTCALRCVHAEMRALEEAIAHRALASVNFEKVGTYELLHVELRPDGGVLPCDGPSCAQCSKHIVDAEFIGGVWLFVDVKIPRSLPTWVRYDPAEFHRLSMLANGAQP